ncbi:TonB-dependent receptor [Sphingobium phenoxybenzoativorans]|uniref:TonB-dependent receptor n=1 Tax=Sphingobium phenoxybenzoativorans TaxID=1592790 RepID=A0A975K6C5_9SPHN|nr:TonB-dependent receptor [Sphingobium phenoxybenzoativorans]QUT05618.1 TonB-dependent receptor [Sphingobium phenoxybenzoativorans]
MDMVTKAALRGSAGLLLSTVLMCNSAHAEAQETPRSVEAPPILSTPDGVDEIVVTANRRAENQQEVPISIAAFSGETLKSQGVVNVVDLPQLTPGLGFTRTLVGTNAFLRGVGTTSAGYST